MNPIFGAKIGNLKITIMRDIFYGWMVRIGDDVDYHPLYSMTQQQIEGLIKLKWPDNIPTDFHARLNHTLKNLKTQSQLMTDTAITYPSLPELETPADLTAQINLFNELLQKFLSPGKLDVVHLKHCKVYNDPGSWRIRYVENQHFCDMRFEDPVTMVKFITKKWK